MFEDKLKQIERHGVVPVIALDDAAKAGALAEALVAGGLPVAEVTFRTGAAAEAIRTMAARGDMLVGAGTVLDVDTARRAQDAGASFIVSPGFGPSVVKFCIDNDLPITPGCVTPTDLQMALDHGLKVVKFFPAEQFGGLKTIKALAAPYGMMRFVPTGGITDRQLPEYLSFKPVVAVGGSWMVSKELLSGGRFDEVMRLTRQAVEIAAAARAGK